MMKVLQSLALAGLLALGAAPLTATAQDSSYIRIPNEDPEMTGARAKARATLPQFWDKMAKPGPEENNFSLKVGFPFGTNNAEHMWLKDIERRDGKLFGTINNVPRDVKTVRAGQRVEIDEMRISDWMYHRSGKIVGGHTIRPLIKRMPPADAARYRDMLAEP